MKALNTKNVQEVKPTGRYETDYHWFNYPHHLEFKQNIQVTIFCSFDFHDFPFDSHVCDFKIGSSGVSIYYLRLLPFEIHSGDIISNGYEPILIKQESHLPFELNVESLPSFEIIIDGYNYSHAGMRLHLRRDDLGLLMGGFYLPMGLFSALSLISFSIDPEIVSFLLDRFSLLVLFFLYCIVDHEKKTAQKYALIFHLFIVVFYFSKKI